MKRIYRLPLSLLVALLFLGIFFFPETAQSQVATTTVLTVSPACPTEGCVIALTATVTANGANVHPGLVTFCDKGPANCENEAPIGRAQLTANGTATVRIGLAAGSHSLRAIFHGTTNYAGSSSASHSFTQTTGAANRVVFNGYSPNYVAVGGGFQFTDASLFFQGPTQPTGSVSFLDTSQNNLNLGSGPITVSSVTQIFTNINGAPYAAESMAEAVLAGDFNNDGLQDALEIDLSGNISVGLGDGNGNFKPGPAFADSQTGVAAPSTVLQALTGDFNGDGKLDIAFPDPNTNVAHVLLGNGDGTFTAAKSTALTLASQLLVIGDFNKDGIPDLLSVSAPGTSGSDLQVLLGKGDGTFTAQTAIPLDNENLVWASVSDFNHDGNQDILFSYNTGSYVAFSAASTLAILKGNGNGTFGSTPVASIPLSSTLFSTGDFDGDGIPDIMDDDTNGISFFQGNGDFTFNSKFLSTYQPPRTSIVGDYLGDGTLQVATSISGGFNIVSETATNGPVLDQLLIDGMDYAQGVPAIADYNNDGLPDLINVYYGFANAYYPPTIYSNLFSGQATATSPVISLSEGLHEVVASYPGDANHDANISPAVAVYSPGVNYSGGFGTGPGLVLNGSATLSNDAIQLNSGGEFQVGSFFTPNRLLLTDAVVSSFDFQIPAGNADGFAYVFQANGPNAVGSPGGGLGYGNPPGGVGPSITNSVAIAFDTHNNQGEGSNSIRIEYNGITTPAGAFDLTPSGIDLHSGHRFNVQATSIEEYSMTFIDLVITDTQTGTSLTHYFYLTTPTLLLGNWGYVGFTSSTGTSTVAPIIYDWTISQPDLTGGGIIADSGAPLFPNGFAGASQLLFNGGSAVNGPALQLTKGTSFEATSTYFPQLVGLHNPNFNTDFDFNVDSPNGDGFTFVLEDHSPTAVGSTGGGLGYGVDYLTPAPPFYAIIPNSLAIKFDLHDNHGEGINSTGLYLNGASPTTPSVDLTPSGINLHSGHNFHARITLTGTDQITLTITDLTVYKVFQTTFTAANASVLQEGAVFAGFTAGTGATPSTIKVLNWTFTP